MIFVDLVNKGDKNEALTRLSLRHLTTVTTAFRHIFISLVSSWPLAQGWLVCLCVCVSMCPKTRHKMKIYEHERYWYRYQSVTARLRSHFHPFSFTAQKKAEKPHHFIWTKLLLIDYLQVSSLFSNNKCADQSVFTFFLATVRKSSTRAGPAQ